MKRTLRLRRDVVAELGTAELAQVGGIQRLTNVTCPGVCFDVRYTIYQYTCFPSQGYSCFCEGGS